LAWTLGYKFDKKYLASPVSRETCNSEQEAR